jgi:hypothetical protein
VVPPVDFVYTVCRLSEPPRPRFTKTQTFPPDNADIAMPITVSEAVVEPDFVAWPAVVELTSTSPTAIVPPLELAFT